MAKKLAAMVVAALALAGCGKTESERSVPTRSVYSSHGMDIVMSGASSWEILSDWQLGRKGEWNKRNYEFRTSDRNKDGVLTGEETEYNSLPIFNYRFR
jgi:hypothetical protein